MAELALNSQQSRAVESDSPAILVSAGAGSGKTEVVAHRIERLLHQSEEDSFQILAVSFTHNAAEELRDRFKRRLGDLHHRVETDTIHEFAFSLLRQHGTRIGLPTEPELLTRLEDRVELLDSWLRQSGQTLSGDPRTLFGQLDLARAQCVDTPQLEAWTEALQSAGAIDYAAMLDRAYELVQDPWMNRHLKRVYEHVVIDEAQNLTAAQYRLLTEIIGGPTDDHLQAMLVGDQRQSIVGFAGADPKFMDQFAQDYEAERIELTINYRSARAIIDVGKNVAFKLKQPTESIGGVEFPAEGIVESRAFDTEDEEAEAVSSWIRALLADGLDKSILAPGESTLIQPEDISVLARSSASLQSVRERLTSIGIESATASTEDDWVASIPARVAVELIAYRGAPTHKSTLRRLSELTGATGLVWSEISELIAPDMNAAVAAVLKLGATAELPAFISGLVEMNADDVDWLSDLAQLQAAWRDFVDRTGSSGHTFGNFRQHIARLQRGDSLDPGVRLLTVHKSQGREFKAVVVIACNEGQFPDFRAKTSEAEAAELRTFYVATSRASRALFLTRSRQRQTRSGPWTTKPSRFLEYVQVPAS